MNPFFYEATIKLWDGCVLEALLHGDRLLSSKIATELADSPEAIKALYEDVVKESMYRIGQLWENGEISVASEHVASAIVEGVLNELYARVVSGRRTERTVVAACVEDEKHQIGIKMVADVFKMHGWNVYFLGADAEVDHTAGADGFIVIAFDRAGEADNSEVTVVVADRGDMPLQEVGIADKGRNE